MPDLRQDQIEDLATLLRHPRHIHGGEPGTGKTPTICTLQAIRWKRDQVGTAWVMPLKLISKNYEEAMRWGHWSDGEVVILEGTPQQVMRQLKSGAKLFLMGFTRFARVRKSLPDYVKAIDIDEYHKGFGGTDSQRTQALYDFTADPKVGFVPMTGTIYSGKPETVYSALQIIEPRYYGTPELFKATHHVLDPFTGKTVGYRNLDVLGEVVGKHSIKRTWREVHGDEQRVYQIEPVDMSSAQRAAYDKFEEQAILELEKFFIDGTKPGVNFIRARQIMEHPNHFPDLRDPDNLPPVDICPGEQPGKLALLDLDLTNAAENKTPIVIFSALRPQQREILELARSYGLRIELLNGDTTPKETEAIDTGFQAGRLDGIVCSPKVADCGFNWQFSGDREVNDAVFVSMDYVDTTFEQACRRFERQKRQAALRAKILKYRSSLDGRIMRMVERKSNERSQFDPSQKPIIFEHH